LPVQKTLTVGALVRGICSKLFLQIIPMVPSSSIAVAVDGEHLACGGFSLGENVHLRNFEFIVDYFSGLSLSSRRADEGTTFVGSTRRGAPTPQWATIGDSTEEFLTASSGEGCFSNPSPIRCSSGASLAPVTTTTWKENAPTTTMFPPWTAVP
jgi:hypothetical protein